VLTDKTVKELLDAFASPAPTPGGGSAAALAGALGASLLEMVAGLPKTRTNSPEERQAMDQARTMLQALRATLVDLIDRDSAAYDLVVAAFRKPKATDEEKAARKAAVQEAMRVATEVPLETLQACASAMACAVTVAECGNPSANSDVGVALQLLTSAIAGARFNIETNIGSLTDTAVVQRISDAMSEAGTKIVADASRASAAAGIT
jgi:formiminotetrahydrofolate cyclodeaminase